MSKSKWGTRACGVFLLWATAAVALPAQTFITLHSFDSTDGSTPFAGLVQATDGNLYGTTERGGRIGFGMIFKITPGGKLTKLYSICSQGGHYCTNGADPYAGLIQATDGDFYGTTAFNGAVGFGTVFSITPSGVLTTLHSFDLTDGANPAADLVQGTDGNFYGTTVFGGNVSECGGHGCGTIFKITPSGTLTTLYSFCSQGGSNCTDGSGPNAGLIQATDGNFYGATSFGGIGSGCNGVACGTIFKITPGGALTTLHSFNLTDGWEPAAALVQATDGNFYGTTAFGGTSNLCTLGCGTVFKMTPGGSLTSLHSFDSTDGGYPQAALVLADGNFYGTTYNGGVSNVCSSGCGTVFKITPSGTFTALHSFDATDGAYLYAGLVQDTNGMLYGTTSGGGATNHGTVFGLSVGLGAFVETQSTSGAVGAAVNILGTNLTGATSVTFNGTAATFIVVSASEITTTVPAGATTGKIQVVTPSRTLSSNVPFRVSP